VVSRQGTAVANTNLLMFATPELGGLTGQKPPWKGTKEFLLLILLHIDRKKRAFSAADGSI
ncbi:MAG: hypothetical protein LC776_10200, partial [Acidobacteria bacterium]|nr:hypothetical protein [Acidobacteriota bacterium]